jgi:hypothetical protein
MRDAQGKTGSIGGNGLDDAMQPGAIGQSSIHEGGCVVQPSTDSTREPGGNSANVGGITEVLALVLQARPRVDPDVTIAGDQNIGNVRRVEKILQGTGANELVMNTLDDVRQGVLVEDDSLVPEGADDVCR